MKQGANAIAIRYEIRNRGQAECRLVLMPFFQFTPKGTEPDKTQTFTNGDGCIFSNGLCLYYRTNGTVTSVPEKTETYFYSYDACDGRREEGRAMGNHEISYRVNALEDAALEVVYEMEPSADTAGNIIADLKSYRASLEAQAGFHSDLASMLSKSANQFIARRESAGGDTILAGFPFFEDWGRDTMIALPGLCISTGQYKTAKKILRTFAANERNGLMPNLFPEGGKEPRYNTVDAALLFINSVYLLYEASGDEAFVWEMYPVMERMQIMNEETIAVLKFAGSALRERIVCGKHVISCYCFRATLSASGISARAASAPDSHELCLPVQDIKCPFQSDIVHGSPFRGQTSRIYLRQTAVFQMPVNSYDFLRKFNMDISQN